MAYFLDCTVPEIWIRGSDFLAVSLTTWHSFIFFAAGTAVDILGFLVSVGKKKKGHYIHGDLSSKTRISDI